MDKLREWGFPAGLLLAWMVASVYTLNTLAAGGRGAALSSQPVVRAQLLTQASN